MLDFILKYWVTWALGLIAAGIGVFAKHYIKLQKEAFTKKWYEREQQAKDEVIKKMEQKFYEEVARSDAADAQIKADVEVLYNSIENLSTGILSIQGKQFREECASLLESNHVITLIEYEQFEEDYTAYKALGGNHRGDALHDRVVEKFANQLK